MGGGAAGGDPPALAAVAVARHLGMKREEIRLALAAFGGVNREADLGDVMKNLSALRERAGQASS